jgi:hypothetical protein
MRFGPRRPSFRKMIAARTSPRRFIRQRLRFKAPRGWGWLTNHRRAAYNRIYNRTRFSVWPWRRSSMGCCVLLAGVVCIVIAA